MKDEPIWQAVRVICTQHELSDDAWIQALLRALRPALDPDHLGIAGGLYFCVDPCSLRPQRLHVVDINARLSSILLHGIENLSPTYVAHAFLNGSFGPGSDFAGWEDIPPVQDGALKAAGAEETSAIRCAELDGAGVWFVSFRKSRYRPSSAEWRLMARVQREISIAHRLRRKLSANRSGVSLADAILDASGRVLHALPSAQGPAERCTLTNAVRRRERTPGGGTAQDSWTLLDGDHVGEPGRVLAFSSRPMTPAFELLSAREREVLAHAIAGQTNKEVAYELGLADATVRVLMLRAARKLGARSRSELLRRVKSELNLPRKP